MNRKNLKAIIIFIIVVLATIGGVAIPTLLHPGEGAEASVAQNQDISATQVKMVTGESVDKVIDDGSNDLFTNYSDDYASNQNEVNEDNIDGPGTEVVGIGMPTEKDINQDWIEERIQLYRDQIADEDLEDFRYIIGKLDMNYVNEIIEGRHGSDIDPILKEYLHSQLTSPEYSRARDLFYAYSHLLF